MEKKLNWFPPQIHNYGAALKVIDFQVIIMGICTYGDGKNTCFCVNKPVLIFRRPGYRINVFLSINYRKPVVVFEAQHGGDQLTLRNFRGGPVRKLETFYLPKKKLRTFRGGPVDT